LFYTAKTLSLIVLLAFCGVIYYQIRRQQQGAPIPWTKPIPGLTAIDEAIGRATEMGRPIHFSPGVGGITDEEAGQVLAGLQYLSYLAEQAGKYNVKLIATMRNPSVYTMAEEIAKEGFARAGASEQYTPETVRFISDAQMAYAAGVLGIFNREKPAANVMIGAWYAETMMLAEAASNAGAISIGGTARLFQIPYLVVSCDYVLIGEEIYAGGAYLSKDRVQLGTLVGQDICKTVCAIALVVGILLATVGVKAFSSFLGQYGK
jgi:hypothetical protein